MRLVLLAILSMILSVVNAQNIPPKKASKIIVLTKDTSSAMLDKITLTLFDKGFAIDNKDDRLKLITTKERSMPKGLAQTKIQAHINDTSIVFTSTLCVQVELNIYGTTAKPTFDPVTYSGLKGSYMRVAWNELEAIARTFGDKIVYGK